jgi:hypothetical protein
MPKQIVSKGRREKRNWTISISDGVVAAEGKGESFQEALMMAFKIMVSQGSKDFDDGIDPRTT